MTEDCEIDSARAAPDTDPASAAATKNCNWRRVKAIWLGLRAGSPQAKDRQRAAWVKGPSAGRQVAPQPLCLFQISSGGAGGRRPPASAFRAGQKAPRFFR
ncbi:hypothetical protein GCM10011341_31870 [Frigidibacter albus]|nr:hypothetical protein GCM10011341_31870 [Frigidibacter albus]